MLFYVVVLLESFSIAFTLLSQTEGEGEKEREAEEEWGWSERDESESEIHLFEPHSIIQKKYFNVISVCKTWIGRPLLRPSGRYRRGHQNYNINYY